MCSFKRILLILILTLPSISLAQRSGGFSFGAMTMFGPGKMGNGDLNNLAPERSMQFNPLGVFIGYSFNKFRLGLNYEHVTVNQTTSSSEVNYTNLTGTETNVGVRLEFYTGKYSAGIIIKPSNSYTLSKTTGTGNSSSYTAKLGLSVQATVQLYKQIGAVFDYSMTTYDDSLPDADVKMNRVGVGLLLTNFQGGR